MTLSEILSKIDLLGFEYKFFYKSSSSYKTAVGGFLSLSLFLGLLITTLLLSRDMFERENIFINSYDERNLKASIPAKDLNLMVEISDELGNFLAEDPEFRAALKITPFLVRYTLRDGRYFPVYKALSLVPCTKELLEENYYNSIKERFDITKMTCLYPYETMEDGSEKELEVCGDKVGLDSTVIFINMTLCHTGFERDPECLKRMERFKQILVTAFFTDTYIQARNHGDIVKKVEKTIMTKVSVDYEYHEFLTFKRNFLNEDIGIFGSDVKEYSFSVVSNQRSNVNTDATGSIYNLAILGQLSFKVTEVRYGKIQDLLASLSGIMNTAILICRVISLFFSRFLFSNNLAAKILESKPARSETELNLKESQPDSKNSVTTFEKEENTKEIRFQNIFQFWLSVFIPKIKVSRIKSHSLIVEAMSLEKIILSKQREKESIK